MSVEKQTLFLSISVYLGKKNLTIFGDCRYGPAGFLRKPVLDRFDTKSGGSWTNPAGSVSNWPKTVRGSGSDRKPTETGLTSWFFQFRSGSGNVALDYH